MLKRFLRLHPKLASVVLVVIMLVVVGVTVASSYLLQNRKQATSSRASEIDSRCGANLAPGGGFCSDNNEAFTCENGRSTFLTNCSQFGVKCSTVNPSTGATNDYVGCTGGDLDTGPQGCTEAGITMTDGGGRCDGSKPRICRKNANGVFTIDNAKDGNGNVIDCANFGVQCFMRKNAPYNYVGCGDDGVDTNNDNYDRYPKSGNSQPNPGNPPNGGNPCNIGDSVGVPNGKFACGGTFKSIAQKCVNGNVETITDCINQSGTCVMSTDFTYVGCSNPGDTSRTYKEYPGHFQCDCGTSRCVQAQGGGGNQNSCNSAGGTCSCGGGGVGGSGNTQPPATSDRVSCNRCSTSDACTRVTFTAKKQSGKTDTESCLIAQDIQNRNPTADQTCPSTKAADGVDRCTTNNPVNPQPAQPITSDRVSCNRCSNNNGCERVVFTAKKQPSQSETESCRIAEDIQNAVRTTDQSCPSILGGDNTRCGGGGSGGTQPQPFACPSRCSNTYGCYLAKFDSANSDASGCNNPQNVKYFYHVEGDLYSGAGGVGACPKIQGESTCGRPPDSQTVKKAPGVGGGGGGGTPQGSRDQRFTCLKTEACWVHGSTPTCPNHNEGSEERPNFRLGLAHAAKLSGKGDNSSNPAAAIDSLNPLTTAESFVLECVSVASRPEGPICTTGKRDTDMQLFGVSNVDTLFALTRYAPATNDDAASTKDENGYRFDQFVKCEKNGGGECALGGEEENDNRFTNVSNPRPTRNPGVNFGTYYWQSYTAAYLPRRYFALNYFTATPQQGPAEPGGPTPTQTETQKSLQQSTLNFAKTVAPVTVPEPEDRNCTVISYDPYGKVFDAQTLEPIAGAVVTLLRKRADGSYTKVLPNERLFEVIKNPFITESDGGYYFPVTDGDYKLSVEHPDYDFPAQASALNRDYAKIYSDIYPALTGDVITQKGGNPEHRDIPITLKADHTSSQPIELKGYFHDPTPDGSVLSGFVSHPFANFTFYSKKIPAKGTVATRYREIGKTQADKEGKFSFKVNTKNFEPGEYFGEADIEKNFVAIPNEAQVNSTSNSSGGWLKKVFIKEATAQDRTVTTVSFEPIPTYLEGYAYDAKGELARSAEVSLYLSYSKIPYTTTVTDENGFFRIPSNQIPSAQYKIVARSEGSGEVPIRTSTFIEKNTKYLADNKINVYSIQDDTKKESAGLAQKSNGFGKLNINSEGQNNVTPITTPTSTSTSGFVLGALLAVLGLAMVAILGMLVFYVVKLRKQETSL